MVVIDRFPLREVGDFVADKEVWQMRDVGGEGGSDSRKRPLSAGGRASITAGEVLPLQEAIERAKKTLLRGCGMFLLFICLLALGASPF